MVKGSASKSPLGGNALAPQDFYQTMLRRSGDAFLVVAVEDECFTLLDVNEKAAQLANGLASNVIGKSPLEAFPSELGEYLTSGIRNCVESRRSFSTSQTFRLPEGRFSLQTLTMPVARPDGAIEHIIAMIRDVTEEANRSESAQHNSVFLRTLGITLPSHIFLMDLSTREVRFLGESIDPTISNWRAKMEESGGRATLKLVHPDDHWKLDDHFRSLAALRNDEVVESNFRILSSDGSYRRHHIRETVYSRNSSGKVELVLGISENMAEQDRILRDVRDLSTQLTNMQSEERRRIAQELHDSTGQHLAAASLALGHAKALQVDRSSGAKGDDAVVGAIDEAARLLREVHHEIRVLSYLLHPPKIRRDGLADALEEFSTGFGIRAGLKMSLDVSDEARGIDDDIATHVFRICQEALTNVYRHAHAQTVSIQLLADDTSVTLVVCDDGVGFDISTATLREGVGLSGVRERMARLGGKVEVSSRPGKTELIASMPRYCLDAVG